MPKKQILYSGNQTISEFERLLKKDAPKKIFLVRGKGSYKKSGAELLFSNIISSYIYVPFYEFTENPKVEDVQKGIKLFKQNK